MRWVAATIPMNRELKLSLSVVVAQDTLFGCSHNPNE